MAEAKQTEEEKTSEKQVEKKDKPQARTKKAAAEPAETKQTTAETADKEAAKAGKRSSKAIKEAEEKAAKEDKKQQEPAEKPQSKQPHKPARSRLERRSKAYRKASELIEKDKHYKLNEALELACKSATTKFDSTVELHIRLNVDPKQADQNIRDSVVLPAGSGKTVRVAVFADEANVKKAKTAGADIAGEDDFLATLEKGQLDFDVLIAMPGMMARLAKYARLLGPKGLMPNPKSGTVTNDISAAVTQSKAGKVEYRVDSNGIIHIAVGKVSFGTDKLQQNADAVLGSIKQNKPASIKGAFMVSAYAASTMGPGVKIDISQL